MKYYGRISDNKDLITKEYADGVVAVGNTQPTASQTKLWINPGQGGAGVEVPTVAEAKALGITGAQVGQAAIVKTVDANGVPTSWEAGNAGPVKSGIYGFYINGNEADPYSMVTYLEDAVGMTPAYMDFANGEFNWGSWENAFFIPKPCMLKYDGTVDYYLDPDDYTKKEDGTASDVADTNYGGNAMMEWGQGGKKIWYKIVPYSGNISAAIYVADHQADAGFQAWSFINKNGDWNDHFYTPIYNGSKVGSTIRSISGQVISKTQTADTERTQCKANGDGWDTEFYCDIILINILLTLITKTTDSKIAIGLGLSNDGTETVNNGFRTGVHNDKGLFWGTSSGASATYTNAVKVFGMENWWGLQWRRFVGLVNSSGTIKYKLTYGTEDGSTGTDYVVSTTGSAYNGYKTGASVPASIFGTYINKMTFDTQQFTPTAASGTASTYYCDGLWTNNNQVNIAFRGGSADATTRSGVWCMDFRYALSMNGWAVGAAPSCKPILTQGGN